MAMSDIIMNDVDMFETIIAKKLFGKKGGGGGGGGGGGDAKIYGVKWVNDESTTMERTDDAVGLSFNINTSSGLIVSDFDDLAPWNGEIVEINGSKFKKFPAAYIRVGKDEDGYINSVAVSQTAHEDGDWYHYDEFYYGCYGASESGDGLASISGVARLASKTRAQFRELASATGDGYQQLDLKHKVITMFLWWIEYATKDSETIMTGRIQNSGTSGGNTSSRPTGGTDSVTTPSGFETAYAQMKWHGVEDFIGNYWEWVDGISGSKNNRAWVCDDPSKFTDTDGADGYEQVSFTTPNSDNVINAFGWDENHPFMCFYTKTGSGGFSDYGYAPNSTSPAVSTGAASINVSSMYGLCYFYRYWSSNSYATIGARLLYIPS